MKKLLLLVSCTNKEYKYRIEGVVETKDGEHPTVWYTDTISFDGDSSEVRIRPPYVIKQTY